MTVEGDSTIKSKKKWTFNLSHYDYAAYFFIALSFASMISTGIFAIPLLSDLFLNDKFDWNKDWTNLLFSITSALGCIWGLMAHTQFEMGTKLIRDTWYASRKLDPLIGEYDCETLNPETNQSEEGYAYHRLVDFWDRENEVPHWLDKGKYWKLFLELQKINKNVKLLVVKDASLSFNKGKGNVTVIIRYINNTDSTARNKNSLNNIATAVFKVMIPQWLVLNTEYKRFNMFSQAEINTITSKISDVNKNIPQIINEILFKEKPVLKNSGNILASFYTYLNKSLPIRIVYNKAKDILPGAKKRQIQYTNENLSSLTLDYLIESILIKSKAVGMDELSLAKLYTLTEFLKKEYDKLGLGEGSSEYHNFHHSLEVAYMSLNMLPKEIHGYTLTSKDFEVVVVAALLHDYDPVIGTSHYELKYSRVPTVPSTIVELKRRRIHDAYFMMTNDEFIRFFRKYESPLLPAKEFATTHPEMLRDRKVNVESKIVEALIWRTDYPFNENAYNNFNQLLKEIDNGEISVEKINLIAEILSLSDLSVTYLSSDPLLAWNRVVKLYEELDFPIVEAVSRTDRFLSLFSEGSLFKEIITRKNFPDVFRQKWDNVYQFFHEGNPANKINNLILEAKTKYEKINMDVKTSNCDFLINNALKKRNEYFIGIVKDKLEIINTQTKLSGIQVNNLEILPGNSENILPFIKDKSVDNFIVTIFYDKSRKTANKERILKNLLHSYSSKLNQGGTIQIVVDDNTDFENIIALIPDHDYKILESSDMILPDAGSSANPSDIKRRIRVITIQNLHQNNNDN
ncbi:HD domain-containing protein [Candidatus Nitrosocosmicus hydrocola]|uniref:HD domain-containing protein n=1 Tax=Candidatus Nitrosocosmicus hydrocola TaxID=1826872 RepID=UPI0011E605AA|nr:HD domain-containing protein [Candidatus Nitrosocosmicus hydrocola]